VSHVTHYSPVASKEGPAWERVSICGVETRIADETRAGTSNLAHVDCPACKAQIDSATTPAKAAQLNIGARHVIVIERFDLDGAPAYRFALNANKRVITSLSEARDVAASRAEFLLEDWKGGKKWRRNPSGSLTQVEKLCEVPS
jgi:hypothetical protein